MSKTNKPDQDRKQPDRSPDADSPAEGAAESAGDAIGESMSEDSSSEVASGDAADSPAPISGPATDSDKSFDQPEPEVKPSDGDSEPDRERPIDHGAVGDFERSSDRSSESDGPGLEPSASGPGMLALVVVLPLVFLAGYVAARLVQAPAKASDAGEDGTSKKTPKAAEVWTCSMHPQIKLPKPGKCPICAMDLILLDESSSSGSGPTLKLSKAAAKLAEIQTSKVHRDWAEAELRFVGKVAYDETRVKTITSWVPGRLDRLFVDYTGVAVRKGDHLVEIYSPELITAQEELLQAIRSVEELKGSSSERVLVSARASVKAARERLELLGVTAPQLAKLERTKSVSDHLTIYAPRGGIVVHKNAMEGSYVKTGSPIYRIADLSVVWVNLEAYESDLAWLRYGQAVSFRTEAFPGEEFEGRISFIDPILDDRTRTVKVRVNVPNAEGRLKPGMFVRATVLTRMSEGGVVMDPTLADKWISPMHPEIVKDEPGDCDVCGMPLVRAESMGLASTRDGALRLPLLVPATAVLLTGKRAVVYVRTSGDDEAPKFEGRVVRLGARAGDHYVVRGGLKQGEVVATNGAFKIDSALQIQAKRSMMLPDDEGSSKGGEGESANGESHTGAGEATRLTLDKGLRGKLLAALAPVVEATLAIQTALAADSPGDAELAAKRLKAELGTLSRAASGPVAWLRIERDLRRSITRLAAARTLTVQREAFSSVSRGLIAALDAVGAPRALDLVACPMAFGGVGGRWLQTPGEITNPYFGASMLRCGDVTQRFRPGRGDSKTAQGDDQARVSMPELIDDWLALQTALAADRFGESKAAAAALAKRLKSTDLAVKAEAVAGAEGLEALRAKLGPLAGALVKRVKKRGPDRALTHAHCPMAMDGKGGDWLQMPGELRNPYLGSAMQTCGDVVATLKPKPSKSKTSVRLPELIDEWLALQTALAADKVEESKAAADALAKRLKETDLAANAAAVAEAEGLEAMRGKLGPLAGALVKRVKKRGPDRALIHARCPMAMDGAGGDWLQTPGELRNPYFGSAMLTCGDVVATLKAKTDNSKDAKKPSSQPTSKPTSKPARR